MFIRRRGRSQPEVSDPKLGFRKPRVSDSRFAGRALVLCAGRFMFAAVLVHIVLLRFMFASLLLHYRFTFVSRALRVQQVGRGG